MVAKYLIYFQKEYEVQVLDSYESVTYSNGQASSVYKQHIPLVNATLPPGKWQTYDIVFNEPKYEVNGKRIKKGTLTVFHNGVLVQNNVEIKDLGKVKLDNNNFIFHAGTKRENLKIFSNGGRVLNFVSISKNFKDAREQALTLIKDLNWSNGFYRRDIGNKVIDE